MLNTAIFDKLLKSSTQNRNEEKPITAYDFRNKVQEALNTIGMVFLVENEKRVSRTQVHKVYIDQTCCPDPSATLSRYIDGILLSNNGREVHLSMESLDKFIEALTTIREELKTLDAKMQEMASKVDFDESSDDEDDDDDWD